MFTIISQIKAAFTKWVAYRNTLAALNALPVDTLLDLDIARDDFRAIARTAVYGHNPARGTPRHHNPALRYIAQTAEI